MAARKPVGGSRKERLLRAKLKKKQQEDEDSNGIGASTFEDILQMSDLSEQSLLHNLRRRYDKDLIYTYVGPILIAINPYKELGDVYGEQKTREYYGKALGALPPHVFALADQAYTALIEGGAVDPENQSIIISGESGAGKTETTKIIMQYLARATSYRGSLQESHGHHSSSNPPVSASLGKLEERVLESNPLLESFGNAKTLRNDNSSRFGKFIEIQFDHHGKIVGAEIMNFLLEKTRIVSQSLGERNYHIFYQLLAGADDALRKKLHLTSPEDYQYLCNSECLKLPSVDDAEEFAITRKCMATIGIEPVRQEGVYDLLAAVLHLGNLQFGMENETSVLVGDNTEESLALIAGLLRVSVESLKSALLTRQLYVGGKVIVQQQHVDQVRDKRDALAKAIYSSLFLWLVTELNRTISRPQNKWGFIGVLDIYGFEKFEWNTFEQLCINYANEKLQRHFNQHMLEVEQEEYTKEGIDWTQIHFQDNQACLDLIEGKPGGKAGIFIALDDVWRLKGEEANRKFVAILHASFGRDPMGGVNNMATQHEWYVHPKMDTQLRFGIRHYAGEVVYDASGFNDKNNETLNDDMKELIRQSESDWVREIFDVNVQSIEAIPGGGPKRSEPVALSRRPSDVGASGHRAGAYGALATSKSRNLREVSVGAQFRFQLQELMNKISLANPRYVRCIKPNEFKRPLELVDADCARQLKYSGMMEAIQIRQRGFALREDHDVFFYDYQVLAPEAEHIEELVEQISTMLGAGKDQWQLGKTKVFLKREVSFKLRKLHVLRCKSAARIIQKWWRNFTAKCAARVIQTKCRQFLAKKELVRRRKAAYRIRDTLLTLVAMVKFEHRLREHRAKVEKAICLQKIARGYLVRKRNILHPFAGLDAKDLDAKISEMENAIAEAAKNKQFELCARLQPELEKLADARKKVRTGKEIDEEIAKLNAALDEAASKKQFALCADLQKQLEGLQELRRNVKEDLNELEPSELDERIQNLEKSIADAMAARDFAKCHQLQGDLDKLSAIRKKKQTPGEIDAEIGRLNFEIGQRMEQKDFETCAAIQKRIDELKERRARLDPVPEADSSQEPEPADAPNKLPVAASAAQSNSAAVEIKTSQSATTPGKLAEPVASVVPPTAAASTNGSTVTVSNSSVTMKVSMQTNVSTMKVPSSSPPLAPVSQSVPAVPSGPKVAQSTTRPISKPMSRSGSSTSLLSAHSNTTASRGKSSKEDASRTVQRLHPSKPLIVQETMTVSEVIKLMKTNRVNAAIVLNDAGSTTGIFTGADAVRCVVVEGLDLNSANVGAVMTRDPKCVATDTNAADALDIMLSGRFRHLLVVDADDAVVGVLDIAKCLHDAIRRIEESSSQLKEELSCTTASAALRSMLEKMLSPSLHDILSPSGEVPVPMVLENEHVFDVLKRIAGAKKPALVVSSELPREIVGVFSSKDLMFRVIAANKNMHTTRVGEVMTPDPETATPETTVLDAFHIMHDGKFLNLPVVDPQAGEILGIADVLTIACASFGKDETRDMTQFWNDALDLRHETASVTSSVTGKARRRLHRDNEVRSRPVSSLHPSPAVIIAETATVLDAAIMMSENHSDALLVVDIVGTLAGILTTTDICRRMVGNDLDPARTTVDEVMTRNIEFVSPEDSALDAMLTMEEGHFRHVPVVNRESGTIVGVLSVSKCICDMTQCLENAVQSTEQLKVSLEKSGAGATVQQLLGPMLEKFSTPTLQTILDSEKRSGSAPAPCVPMGTIVRDVVKSMELAKKAALVVDQNGRLCGTFSPDELVMNVIAKKLDLWTTPIESVMRADPEIVTPSTSVLEALQIVHECKCFNIPVVAENTADEIVGMVSALSLRSGAIDIIYGEDRERIQEFWETALQLEQPVGGMPFGSRQRRTLKSSKANGGARRDVNRTVAQLRPKRVMTVEESVSIAELVRLMGQRRMHSVLVVSPDGSLVGIITNTDLVSKVVAENLPVETTRVGDVMTRNPTFVSMEDSAMDALEKMLEGRFRHLPVVDESEQVVGILSISKCLYDAVRKMERAEQSSHRQSFGSNGAIARTFSAGMGGAIGKLFAPDVRTVIDQEQQHAPEVQPYTSVFEVARMMAATKKAALVIANGQYVGVFTPRDLQEKVLARGLPVHTTPVCEVLSDDAITIFGTSSVADALHAMHENHTLYLAVLESETTRYPIGLVDVLSLSYGSFAKGNPAEWKSFWRTTFNAVNDDDDETASSVHSYRSALSMNRSVRDQPRRLQPVSGDVRPVSKLRPSKTVTVLDDCSVTDAAIAMGKAHTDVTLVISHDGSLRGILTDTDVTRRVIALGNDPHLINVCDAMTPNPTFVDDSDSAMDAMFLMLEGRFRHLPVMDSQGMVAGMLRIQKCLYDAITRLERVQNTSQGRLREKLERQMTASGLAVNEQTIQQMLGPLVEKMLLPTLEKLLQHDAMPPLVRPTDTVVEVTRRMAATRKAALVVEDDSYTGDFNRSSISGGLLATAGLKLVGMFTTNDLLVRVVGENLDAATTTMSEVMTHNPETVTSKTSFVDALHIMHQHRDLSLPVVDEETGAITGLVDVLSLCQGSFASSAQATAGATNSDASDWRSFWDMSLALARDDDERSEHTSVLSASVAGSRLSRRPSVMSRSRSYTGSSYMSREPEGALRPVSSLHPSDVTQINEYFTVAEAAKRMRQAQEGAVAITTDEGELRGILTDTDITCRVLARDLDPETCSVAMVMTKDPCCVSVDEPAIEAITRMLEGRFKHLPVVGADGVVQGMLDISKCLNDTITCMEHVQHTTETAASEALGLGTMMEEMFRPTVGAALENESRPPIVHPTMNVAAATKLMASAKNAAIVTDGHEIVGMLTPKDLLAKLVSRGLDANTTQVEEVMMTTPGMLTPDARILDGLRLMHESGQLFMPVVNDTNEIVGMADVLSLSYGQFANSSAAGSGSDWRQFWQTSLNVQEEVGYYDLEDDESVGTIEEFERDESHHSFVQRESMGMGGMSPTSHFVSATYSEIGDSASVVSAALTATTSRGLMHGDEEHFVFKVQDKAHGLYHRILCRFDSFDELMGKVRAKLNTKTEHTLRLKYKDEDGDIALLTSDESLVEAVHMARRLGWKRIVLKVDIIKPHKSKSKRSVSSRRRHLSAVDEDAESVEGSKKGHRKHRSRKDSAATQNAAQQPATLVGTGASLLMGLGSLMFKK